MTDLVHPDARLIDATSGSELAGSALARAVSQAASTLDGMPPGVVFALMSTDTASVVRYLGCLAARRPVALLDSATAPDDLMALTDRFRPAVIAGSGTDAPHDFRPAGTAPRRPPHPDLAVLLPTSGSTGNPKLVRLSRGAVLANARQIATALTIGSGDVTITSLPLHYSYGMSVLNSHLLQGAAVVVEGSGAVARPFWDAVDRFGVTSIAGVPYHYEMLRRLRFSPRAHPSLRALTQAGGRLADERIAEFSTAMRESGGRFFVMYGQTEAGPRMATLPSSALPAKLGSVGPALPGGSFTVREPDAEGVGEVVYRGPNVMMGYAETESDLAEGDVCGGVLHTGDLGRLDEDGCLWLTGRLKRIAKVFGVRVALDDLERIVRPHGLAAAVAGDDRAIVFVERADDETRSAVAKELAARLRTHVSGFDVRAVEGLPLLPSGKVDYRRLEALR